MTLKKINFNHVDGMIWLDEETFKALVNYYLVGHPAEVDKIKITGYEHGGSEGNV